MFKILNSNLEPKPDCSSLPRYYMCHYVWKEGREEGTRRSKKKGRERKTRRKRGKKRPIDQLTLGPKTA